MWFINAIINVHVSSLYMMKPKHKHAYLLSNTFAKLQNVCQNLDSLDLHVSHFV